MVYMLWGYENILAQEQYSPAMMRTKYGVSSHYVQEKCFSSPLDSFLYLIIVEGRRVMDYGFYDY